MLGRGNEFLPLVDFVFEINPLEKPDIDQCISAVCQPLQIIYNAVSHIFALSVSHKFHVFTFSFKFSHSNVFKNKKNHNNHNRTF